MAFVPDPVAWTEVPETLRVLGRQRDRWHRGLADVLRRHRHVFANPRYRALGLVVYPYYLIVELLGPVVEALGIVAVLILEEFSYRRYHRWSDLLLLLVWSVVEGFGYRQLTVAWRLRGLWRYFRGSTDWGVMSRSGFGKAPGASQQPQQPSGQVHPSPLES